MCTQTIYKIEVKKWNFLSIINKIFNKNIILDFRIPSSSLEIEWGKEKLTEKVERKNKGERQRDREIDR